MLPRPIQGGVPNNSSLLRGGYFALIALGIAALYFCTAKLGFLMAFKAEQVTAVWAPTGISIAAVLLMGYRVWPGIALGAFLTNVTTNEPILTAAIIACGNTLEALSGAWIMRRFTDFDLSLSRMSDVRVFVLAALCAPIVSATIGVGSLCLSGLQPLANYTSLWLLWWVGDTAGALIVAPVLLVWGSRPSFFMRASFGEAALILIGFISVTLAVFTDPLFTGGRPFIYLVFPFLIWAAMRFGQRATVLVTLLASGIAIWATTHNLGPFIGPVDQNLTALQIFMAVVAVTGLFLSAAVSERAQVERMLREADRRKDEFLSTLAHELRNPLASLSNAVHIIKSGSAEKFTEAGNILDRQLSHLIHLVNDLVDVSRISHGKIMLQKHPVLLEEAVSIACDIVRPVMDSCGHSFSVRLPPEPIWLNGDPTRLAQIFANLLANAAKYTPEGGKICLEADIEDQRVTVRVSDNGIGIPAEMLSKIFDIFVQVENSMERSHGGLGIGLTLTKSLVSMHEGEIDARSGGQGRGSEFIVRLPTIPAPENIVPLEKVAKTPSIPAAERRYRILVVDDNQIFANTFSYMLAALGHEVRTAHDGKSALEIAAAYLPEVVLLDVGLPQMNGYEVCERMRAMPELKGSILIAQTGWSQAEHRERSKAAGFAHHIVKPVTIEYMKDLLESLDDKMAA